jgi:hypothetical protein
MTDKYKHGKYYGFIPAVTDGVSFLLGIHQKKYGQDNTGYTDKPGKTFRHESRGEKYDKKGKNQGKYKPIFF